MIERKEAFRKANIEYTIQVPYPAPSPFWDHWSPMISSAILILSGCPAITKRSINI